MTTTYDEHPSKVGAWREGRFVVHPDAAHEDCTVWFPMGHDAEGTGRWEGLLAQRLAFDRALVCAIPFFARGVNFGDVVSLIESGEGAPVAVKVVKSSASRTIHVGFPDADPGGDDRWQAVMRDLEAFECWFDVLSPMFLGLSVQAANLDAVLDFLLTRADQGQLEYEIPKGDAW